MNYEEIQEIFGEPGILSGMRGDLYKFMNGTDLLFYYDADGMVTHIKIINKDDETTLLIE